LWLTEEREQRGDFAVPADERRELAGKAHDPARPERYWLQVGLRAKAVSGDRFSHGLDFHPEMLRDGND
jgi:hypothetical protein